MLHFKFPLCSYNLLLQLDSVGNTVDGQMGKYACMTSTVAIHADIKLIIVEHTMVGLSLAIYSSFLSFLSESVGTSKISGQKNVFYCHNKLNIMCSFSMTL